MLFPQLRIPCGFFLPPAENHLSRSRWAGRCLPRLKTNIPGKTGGFPLAVYPRYSGSLRPRAAFECSAALRGQMSVSFPHPARKFDAVGVVVGIGKYIDDAAPYGKLTGLDHEVIP